MSLREEKLLAWSVNSGECVGRKGMEFLNCWPDQLLLLSLELHSLLGVLYSCSQC